MIVFRGEEAEAGASEIQAERFRRRYPAWGRWGLSAFYAESDADVGDLGAGPLSRFESLGVYRIADLEAAGFELFPTFRTPHVTIAFDGDLREGLDRLEGVVVDITPEGIVHVCDVPGSVASNAHLLDTDRVADCLPENLPDPVELGGTRRDGTAQSSGETPENTAPDGTRRHRPGRDSGFS